MYWWETLVEFSYFSSFCVVFSICFILESLVRFNYFPSVLSSLLCDFRFRTSHDQNWKWDNVLRQRKMFLLCRFFKNQPGSQLCRLPCRLPCREPASIFQKCTCKAALQAALQAACKHLFKNEPARKLCRQNCRQPCRQPASSFRATCKHPARTLHAVLALSWLFLHFLFYKLFSWSMEKSWSFLRVVDP